jgi:hypothetical protein
MSNLYDDLFLPYYERERASLLQQLEQMQSKKWTMHDNSRDITDECIERTKRSLAELDALAEKLNASIV